MLKKRKINLTLRGLAFAALAVFCFASPKGTISGVAWIIGLALILVGVVTFFIGRKTNAITGEGMRIFSAVVFAALGLIIIIRPQIIGMLLGLLILFEGVNFLVASLRYRSAGITYWWLLLSFGIATMLLGIWAVLDYLASARILSIGIGIGCLANAVNCFAALSGISKVERFFDGVHKAVSGGVQSEPFVEADVLETKKND